MKIYVSLFIGVFIVTTTMNAERRPSVSVITPCLASHIQYLSSLLENMAHQSLIPDELVISVSQVSEEFEEELDLLRAQDWPFRLKICSTKERKFAGENRNIAIENSTGDLIISQDADDISHSERVEIIYTLFKDKQFDMLLHYFWRYDFTTPQSLSELTQEFNTHHFMEYPFDFISVGDADIRRFFTFFNQEPYMRARMPENRELVMGIHFGNCAFSRKVFHRVKYADMRSAQDYDFMCRVLSQFRNNLLLHLPLIFYVRTRSSLEERTRSMMKNDEIIEENFLQPFDKCFFFEVI